MELFAPIKFDDVVTDKNINEAYRIIRKNTIHRKKLTVFEILSFNILSLLGILIVIFLI